MLISIISQGLVWAILFGNLKTSFESWNFPDMTTEGSFLGSEQLLPWPPQGVNFSCDFSSCRSVGCLLV